MLGKLKKSNDEKGFTIIEVMIVLAIAGLIILIVFLAIPALQRNSRNTQRKSDISRIAAATSNFVSDNNGTKPATVADAASIVASAGKLSQLNGLVGAPAATLTAPTTLQLGIAAGAQGAYTTLDGARIVTGATCGTGGATVTTGGAARSIAIQYAIESGAGGATGTAICQDI